MTDTIPIPIVILCTALLSLDASAQTQSIPQIPVAAPTLSWEPMDETLRSEVDELVVVARDKAANESITGSYEEVTPGLIGGINEGAELGTLDTEIGGVNVSFPVPILTIPGAVYGGLSGTMKREIQELRDELTEELASAESHPLTNTSLALDVHHGLTRLPQLSSKVIASELTVPEAMDAVLHVGFSDVTIHVADDEAILTVSALAELRRRSDDTVMYKRRMQYLDRDTLANWNDNDRALWRDYANFAAHYLGRELAAEVFGRVMVEHELRPEATGTVKRDRRNEYHFETRSPAPELAWTFRLVEGGENRSAAERIARSTITYDLEIYDNHRLVYSRRGLPDMRHVVPDHEELCGSYRWSVRPVFDDGSRVAYGEWMRLNPDPESEPASRNGLVGRNASIAPAYTQDFASLNVKCRRR